MSLKKDLQKWKATFLAIDIALAALVLVVLGYCCFLICSIDRMPEEGWSAEISSRQEALAQLEVRIQEQRQAVAQAEETSSAALAQAQAALAAVQTEYDTVSLEYDDLKSQAEACDQSAAVQAQMRENIAETLQIDVDQVNVKATTEEKLGFTGTGEGMSCHAVCLLEE